MLADLRSGDRRALARAITLVESTRAEDRRAAAELLAQAAPCAGKSLRLGVSGAPGVGKSTFIEALGLHLVGLGHRVAVLAVDPSSSLTGGSILGDKTRMTRLSMSDSAYVRPSPSSGALGGIASRTREVMLLCEAAGFDIVIVETVGVGQSESAVSEICDLFVLLQQPQAGDDLQAMKRGVRELADVVVVNKADLDPAAARLAALQFGTGAGGEGSAHVISALRGEGIEALWIALSKLPRKSRDAAAGHEASTGRPFRILGLQQVAIGALDKERLRHLWVDLLGLRPSHRFVSVAENVDEDIVLLGSGAHAIEFDLMQPVDPAGRPAVQTPALNHIGLWVDDLQAAVRWLSEKGMRFAPGGIRKGAAGHDVCFIHPRASDEFAFAGEGVLIELVQAPAEILSALE